MTSALVRFVPRVIHSVAGRSSESPQGIAKQKKTAAHNGEEAAVSMGLPGVGGIVRVGAWQPAEVFNDFYS